MRVSTSVVLPLVLVLAACGGGVAGTASPSAAASSSRSVASAPAGSAAASVAAGVQHITIAYSSKSYAQIAAPVAQDQGIFRKNGIDAEFLFGPNGTKALVAGQVQVSLTSTEEAVAADENGAHIVTVATMVPYLQHVIMARPEIKTIQDLKGKPVGVTKRGTLPHTALKIAYQRAGMDVDKDSTIVELNDTAGQILGLTNGSIFASSFSPPNDEVAAKQGAHVLVDLRAEHIPYPAAQALVDRDWAAKNDALVTGFIRSMAEATALNKTQPDVVAKIYAKFAETGDDAAKQAVQQAVEAVPVDMLPTADGIKAVQQIVAQSIPSAGTADPSKYFDDSYIKRLEAEGFYKQLGA